MQKFKRNKVLMPRKRLKRIREDEIFIRNLANEMIDHFYTTNSISLDSFALQNKIKLSDLSLLIYGDDYFREAYNFSRTIVRNRILKLWENNRIDHVLAQTMIAMTMPEDDRPQERFTPEQIRLKQKYEVAH